MSGEGIFRTLRGVVGNAVTWGAAWAGLAMGAFALLLAAGQLPDNVWLGDGLFLAVRFGVVGAFAGAAFSSVIRGLYRGRRLRDISSVRFGVAGGVVTGVFVPIFLQTMNVVSGGDMVPWALVLDDVPWVALFGGIAAAGTLKLAKRADAIRPADSHETLAGGDPVGSERWRARQQRVRV